MVHNTQCRVYPDISYSPSARTYVRELDLTAKILERMTVAEFSLFQLTRPRVASEDADVAVQPHRGDDVQ